MFNLSVKKIGSVAIVHCEGRIVRSDAAFRLRDAVTRQRDARVVVLDLSGVEALEGGGLGMLLFLQMWARDRGIQLKVFDPSDAVRQSLGRNHSAAEIEIAGMGAVLALLVWGPGGFWDSFGGHKQQIAPDRFASMVDHDVLVEMIVGASEASVGSFQSPLQDAGSISGSPTSELAGCYQWSLRDRAPLGK
jgi:anti-anti-sigma regulatory factor